MQNLDKVSWSIMWTKLKFMSWCFKHFCHRVVFSKKLLVSGILHVGFDSSSKLNKIDKKNVNIFNLLCRYQTELVCFWEKTICKCIWWKDYRIFWASSGRESFFEDIVTSQFWNINWKLLLSYLNLEELSADLSSTIFNLRRRCHSKKKIPFIIILILKQTDRNMKAITLKSFLIAF